MYTFEVVGIHRDQRLKLFNFCQESLCGLKMTPLWQTHLFNVKTIRI